MKIGIVGLPNVGKSTLFNALTSNNVLAANYPFATIEPNVGIVPLPDKRLKKLAEIYNSQKILPATVTFVDIAGIVRGASEGQGLGNKFLGNIRECDCIVQVVRAFNDSDVSHVDNFADPQRDIETINTELILADLQTIDTRLKRINKDQKEKLQAVVLQKAREILDEGSLLFGAGQINAFSDAEKSTFKNLQLLTAKPFIFVFNVDETDLASDEKLENLKKFVGQSPAMLICAKLEAELSELPSEEAVELLQELGQTESGLDRLAKAGFNLLGLQTYLTAGPKEVRAWTIKQGSTAPEAAGVIHTDFQRGFIRAEVVSYPDLIASGSLQAARSAGKARLEGKDYIMQANDVVEFRFNV